MSVEADLDSSLNVRRSLRHAVAQSLASREDTPQRSNGSVEVIEETGLSAGKLRRSKRIKLEVQDEEDGEDSEEELSPPSKSGPSRPKRKYSSSGHPKIGKRRRHSSRDFMKKRSKHMGSPLRRSTREKRLVFATFNSADMIKQIEGQHHYPLYEAEDWMDPYEKLLSPHRNACRSTRHSRGAGGAESGDGVTGGQSSGGEGKKGEEDEIEENGDGEEDGSDKEEEEQEEEEEEEESEQSDEGEGEVGYYLRKRRPVIYQYQPVLQVVEDDTPPKTRRRRRGGGNQTAYHSSKAQSAPSSAYSPRQTRPRASQARKRQAQHHGSSSTSSSGSDSDEAKFRRRKKRSMAKARSMCLPMNFDREDVTQGGVIRDRARIGASLADVDPMNIDREVTFDSVGGHKQHIRALKEMIVFPLLYPEVFERFKISPPRGVLFFGPPGCGKTLMARALANECSKGGKKVAFFMRKGADCLSKWVGESERQLRLLFDQAYQMRPSIIFFDEIDGLAPVRSSRQDQIHSSIVSTLLALMDGLDNRGEIVVIGATNRIDAIDPALRRPGRFDREFVFPLPSREDRLSILTIHTRKWQPQLKPAFLLELADNTVGYCGADLKALCTEAALFALRRKYPQIYNTTQKLVLDVSTINVQGSDFYKGLKSIVPTAQRSDASSGRALPETVRPLFLEAFNSLLSQVGFIFPPAWKLVSKAAKEVRGLLEIEAKHTAELKTTIEKLDSNQHTLGEVIERSSKKGGRNSLSSRKQPPLNASLEVHMSKVNHTSVHNWGGGVAVDKRASSVINSKSPHSQCTRQSNHLFKLQSVEDVYFDLTEVVENETNGSPSTSILQPEDQDSATNTQSATNQSSDNSTTNPLPSSRYLSLSSHPHSLPPVYHPRLILCDRGGMGQSTHLAPALLHALEDLQVQTLDLPALFAVSSKSPEEACTQIFREAKRLAPAIVYVPRISSWWDIVPATFHATFLSILYSLPTDTALLVLATAECPWSDLPPLLKDLFREVNSETFTAQPPSIVQRKRFFSTVLLKRPLLSPPPPPETPAAIEFEELPVAPAPEPRELTSEELAKIEKQRESVLRELRIFLRDATNKLLAERKFKEFVKPVNPEEVPDYHEIIYQPMDLSTIMRMIDEHRYTTPKQWIADVNLVTMNALEYNPEHDSESRLLRHRAVALQDMANSILDHELSEDFEKQCEEIAETYNRIGKDPSESSPMRISSALKSRLRINSISEGTLITELYNAPRRSLRQQGLQAEEKGFDYYSPSKPKQFKRERTASESEIHREESMECEDQSKEDSETNHQLLVAQSEPAKMVSARKHSLQNPTVRRQIIRPWEDRKEKSASPKEASQANVPKTTERTSVTTAAEALVEMGTGSPPKQDTGMHNEVFSGGNPVVKTQEVVINQDRLFALYEKVIAATEDCSCDQMERIHATFDHLVFRHRMATNRSALLDDLELAIHQTLSTVLRE